MKKQILLSALLFILLPVISFAATVQSITNITMAPPAGGPGTSVQVSWTYTMSDGNNNPAAMVLVSDQSSLRNANTGGQWVMIGDGCSTPGNPATSQVGPGCSVGGHGGPNGVQTYSAGPYTFNLPAGLNDGTTYYIIVAMRDYNTYLNPGQSIDTQAFYSFTTPPPVTGVSMTKSVEVSPVIPGQLVMYTIDYTYANATNFIISDVIPPYCTLVTQSSGGTNSGTTAGSTLTWNIGSTIPHITDKVWYIVSVDPAAPYSTAINGAASWVINEIPGGGVSNDPTLMTVAPFSLVKSESVAAAAIGDIVTYTIDFHSGGDVFSSYDPFDNDINGFFKISGGGTANPGNWSYSGVPPNGYLASASQGAGSYPRYLKNSATDFCFGMIQGDVYIGNTGFMDSLISFRDNGLADAGAISYGVGVSSDHTPGDIYLQKAAPYQLLSGLTNPNGFSASSNTWYTVKILVTDAGGGAVRIQAKVWQRGTAEPAMWYIDYTDNSGMRPACGFVGFQGHPDNFNYYDNLKIIKSNPTTPIVYDTIPAIIDFTFGSGGDATHAPFSYAGGMVSWNIYTSLTDNAYSLTWWGTVNNCGNAINKCSYGIRETSPVDSNAVTLNVAICPQTPTSTVSFTDSPTSTMTYTYTQTLTITNTVTPTMTPTKTCTQTPSFTPTITPIIPQFALTKSVNPTSAGRGDTVTYTIHYSNTGLIALSGFEVWDTAPTKVTVDPLSISAPGTYNPGTGVIDWMIGAVPLGGSGDLTFNAVMNDTINRNDVIGNIATGNCTFAGSAAASNQANVTANVPLLQLTPVTNYPNPFNGDTTIVFDLTLIADSCSIKFYTISGELVKTMDFAEMKSSIPGGGIDDNPPKKTSTGLWRYRVYWNGENKAGNKLSSGVYIYQIKASAGNEQQKAMSRLAIIR